MAISTKITLTLEKELIERAKKYAQAHNRSLSNLIEELLHTIIEADRETGIELTPLVKSLKGSVKVPGAGAFDEKELLEEELMKKYVG